MSFGMPPAFPPNHPYGKAGTAESARKFEAL